MDYWGEGGDVIPKRVVNGIFNSTIKNQLGIPNFDQIYLGKMGCRRGASCLLAFLVL